jgi:hypothetical protein
MATEAGDGNNKKEEFCIPRRILSLKMAGQREGGYGKKS